MRRIKLDDQIASIIDHEIGKDQSYEGSKWGIVFRIKRLIQNGYRRRHYHKKGYSCNACGKFHGVGQICKGGKRERD